MGWRRLSPLILFGTFVLLFAVMVPGLGVHAMGAPGDRHVHQLQGTVAQRFDIARQLQDAAHFTLCGGQFLVQARAELGSCSVEPLPSALQLQVQSTERRTFVACDEDRRVEAAVEIEPTLLEDETHQRLDARHQYTTGLCQVLVLEGDRGSAVVVERLRCSPSISSFHRRRSTTTTRCCCRADSVRGVCGNIWRALNCSVWCWTSS